MADEELDPQGLPEEEVVTEEVADESLEEESSPTVEDYARARGWKPKDEWEGEGEHRSAQEFLDFGLDRAKDVSRDLKDLRKTTETMAETQARIMRDNVEKARMEERERLMARHEQAVEEGDTESARQIVGQLSENAAPTRQDTAAQFAAENPWFNTDPEAHAYAVSVAGMNTDKPPAEQMRLAKEAVLKRFPEHAPAKQEPAKAIEVAKPAATARPVKKTKTFHDLPREAQEAARAMVKAGMLKDTDGYVRQYFNKEGTVE